mmetsp:Transcript_33497/g.72294  ORF Transcript_33497/g.72294 Transcript_33497/m.72294 type:complete len:269 (-) Transcript_33497:137-943(-)
MRAMCLCRATSRCRRAPCRISTSSTRPRTTSDSVSSSRSRTLSPSKRPSPRRCLRPLQCSPFRPSCSTSPADQTPRSSCTSSSSPTPPRRPTAAAPGAAPSAATATPTLTTCVSVFRTWCLPPSSPPCFASAQPSTPATTGAPPPCLWPWRPRRTQGRCSSARPRTSSAHCVASWKSSVGSTWLGFRSSGRVVPCELNTSANATPEPTAHSATHPRTQSSEPRHCGRSKRAGRGRCCTSSCSIRANVPPRSPPPPTSNARARPSNPTR